MTNKLLQLSEHSIRLLTDRRMLAGLVRWPVFSFTSYRIVSRLRKQGIAIGTLIDVGANIGQFAVSCAKLYPGVEIFSYEPHPAVFSRLARLADSLPGFTAYNCALGDCPGVAELTINTHSHSSSLLRLNDRHKQAFPDAREAATVQVKVNTLDDEFRGRRLKGPVLLKLDVQGYEARVLTGARELLSQVDWLILEASFRPLYEGEVVFNDLFDLLRSWAFELVCPIGLLEDPFTEEILQMDVLFRPRQRT
jgi:FkbM family methyltransferase